MLDTQQVLNKHLSDDLQEVKHFPGENVTLYAFRNTLTQRCESIFHPASNTKGAASTITNNMRHNNKHRPVDSG